MTKKVVLFTLKFLFRILFNTLEFFVALGAAFYIYNYVIAWNAIIAIISGVAAASLVLEITSWIKDRIGLNKHK